MGASAESLANRYENLLERFQEHREQIATLQTAALDGLLPELQGELDLDDAQLDRARAFLSDEITVWRFLRRSRFDDTAAYDLLRNTLKWRLSSSLDLLNAGALEPLYTENPVFFFHPRLADRFGRPVAVLNLKHVKRTADGSLDALKEFIGLGCEVGRRYLSELSRKSKDEQPILQLILLVDLAGAGMSNLEIELLPFLLDLLKKHFPSMVGAMFILNFGWAYAGMWAVAKRVLPQPALDRILFPSKTDLLQFFNEESLLKEHGGNVRYRYTFKGSVLARVGRPAYLSSPYVSAANSPLPSQGPSRASSYESLADVYHSLTASPRSSRPGTPSGAPRSPFLSMTTLTTAVEANERKTAARPLRRNTSQDFRSHLPGGDAAENTTDSELSGEEAVRQRVERRRAGGSSQNSSLAASRDASPHRKQSGTRSLEMSPVIPTVQITAGSPVKGDVSRFSSSNPTWGYRPSRDGRRRKRDLFRSLFYLVSLRLLALRRRIEDEVAYILGWFVARLRALGLMTEPPPPPSPEPDRAARRSRRRKAVSFVDLDGLEDDHEPRPRKRRLPHAARAMSPSAKRRERAAVVRQRRRDLATLLVAILTTLLVFRASRGVAFLQAGAPGGKRARILNWFRRETV